MKIEKVRLDKYEGPDDEYITLGKIYKVMRNIEEEDGEYVIFDDYGDEHVICPEWCTIIEDEFGVRETIKKYSEEWSGESLPPVGEIVRHTKTGNSVEIACYFHGSIVFWDFNIGGFHAGVAEDFEPIKSQKQKEIDKIASELLESVNKNGEDFKHLEGPIAEHLYNAGLRFTEDSK